ncbi:winged helix DNA-binding domain-containing protein [Kineosporiaceae bacterium B12]|nr:winged helix DNA-binding domain-containing protein [Kineococcus rubinsiae]
MTPSVTRAAVLAHRFAAQQLHRPSPGLPAHELAVAGLGIPDVPAPAAVTAVAVRGGAVRGGTPGDGLVLVWGARGAPALHRRAELPWLAGALWPLSDADAAARIGTSRTRAAAALGLGAFTAVAHAVREVLAGGEPVSKAELSRGVTERVPDALSIDCAPCGARHVSGGLLQQAGLVGGAEVLRGGRAARYRLLPGLAVPTAAAGTPELLRRYLALLGPARPADVAAHLGTSVSEARRAWPGDLVEVSVDGRSAWSPAEDAEALGAAAPPATLRLLPAGDPWLVARDRGLVLPDRARHRDVWKPVAPPGVVLLRGEVAGTWRAAVTGRRLDVTVTPFAALPATAWRLAEHEAGLVAAARGVADVRLVRPS